MSHHDHNASPGEDSERFVEQKLGWLTSPVVDDGKFLPPGESQNLDPLLQGTESASCNSDANKIPRFKKHSHPTNVELFYDLWFVANLQVFTAVHTIDNGKKLSSYIGYIIILWFDWFLVALYDVRYLADSVFERVARVIHMGVMVGFTVVAVNYTPEEQSKQTFQAASLILMASRLALAARYSGILWHIRHKQGKLPITITIALNAMAASIYLGLSFRFTTGRNSRAFIAWYAILTVETFLQLWLSLRFQVLSFDGTHLTERITASTLFMLGEGVNNLAENIVTIVKNNNGWTPPTIGNLTAGITTIYIVFMIYFDWMAHHHQLAGIRQRLWAIVHLPFHVMLLLFSEGATQFVQWWKIVESLRLVNNELGQTVEHFMTETAQIPPGEEYKTVANSLENTVNKIFDKYMPTDLVTFPEISQVLDNISSIPCEYWDGDPLGTHECERDFWGYYSELLDAVDNSIFISYKIDTINNTRGSVSNGNKSAEIQAAAYFAAVRRFMMTYQYTFMAAGLTLILMTFLYSILRARRSWNLFIFLRIGLFTLISIAVGLLALIIRNPRSEYPVSPWLLPTLSLIFFIVLILSYFPRRPHSSVFSLSRAWKGRSWKRRSKDGAYAQLGSEQGWYGSSGRQNSTSLPLATLRSREDGSGQGLEPTPDTEFSPSPYYQQTSGRPEYFAAVQ